MFYQTAEVKRLKEEEGLSHAEAFKQAGLKWNDMSEEQKKPYDDENDKDIKRHEKQLSDLEKKGYFMTEDGVKSTDLPVDPKKKWGKDVVLPSRPMSAYNAFQKMEREAIKAKHPDAKHTEMFGILSKEWDKLSDKDKKKYEKEVEADTARFDREMAELIKNGFFIYEKDGKSSADVQKKIKKDKKKEEDADKTPEEKVEKVKRKK